MRDVMTEHMADLGGPDGLSEAEKSIIRRAATMTVALEKMELDFALAESADPKVLETYQRVSNTLRRMLETVGIRRRKKDITPALGDYLASRTSGAAVQ